MGIRPVGQSAPVRIGINALYLIPGGVGGTEIYLRNLLSALAEIDSVNRYFVFTNRETGPDLLPKAPNFQSVPQPIRAVSRPLRMLWEQTGLPLRALRLKLDVLLNPGFTAPLWRPCPQVTVFHDLQHKRHPEYFRWFDLPFWRFFLFWSAKISDLLLAISPATAADLQKYYGLPEPKIRTIPLGAEGVFFDLARQRRPEPFLLAISTQHPHKNLDGLLRAFAIFRQSHTKFRLVVCGMRGFFSDPLYQLRDGLGLSAAVEFPGWIPRKDVYDLYARAWACIQPSLFEGFGLPVVEALAAGVPTACSAIEPLAEIAGDAALQFDPHDIGAMADAMGRITDDTELRQRLVAAGPARAAQFSWKATAEATLQALLETARRTS